MNRFGFGQITEVELLGETKGIFRKFNKWDGLSITRFPIGQGISTSPLQLVQSYCALANDGVMPQLHFVDKYVKSNGLVVKKDYSFKRRVIKKKSAIQITEALKTVTKEGGTGTKAAVEGYEVAGKTGTAQFGSKDKTHAWFISFAPFDNPEIAMVVLIEAGGEGHDWSVPATEQILREYFKEEREEIDWLTIEKKVKARN